MPQPCLIQLGVAQGDGPANEPNILTSTLDITPAREKKTYQAGSRCTTIVQYSDPTLTFAFDGYIKTTAGLADQHPGTTVDSLVNYGSDIHGFANDEGVMVYEDPSRGISHEDLQKTKFNVVQYPHVVLAV